MIINVVSIFLSTYFGIFLMRTIHLFLAKTFHIKYAIADSFLIIVWVIFLFTSLDYICAYVFGLELERTIIIVPLVFIGMALYSYKKGKYLDIHNPELHTAYYPIWEFGVYLGGSVIGMIIITLLEDFLGL